MGRNRRPSPQTMAVLEALSEDPSGWSYGYDLCRRLNLKAGTVYPILIRLAERGQVETTWEKETESGRPRRHLYRLSTLGAQLVAGLDSERTPRGRTSPGLGTVVVPE